MIPLKVTEKQDLKFTLEKNWDILPANMSLLLFLRFKIFTKLVALWFECRFLCTSLFLPTWKLQTLRAMIVFWLSFWPRRDQDTHCRCLSKKPVSPESTLRSGAPGKKPGNPLETRSPFLGVWLLSSDIQLCIVTQFQLQLIKFYSSHCLHNASVSTACLCKDNWATI